MFWESNVVLQVVVKLTCLTALLSSICIQEFSGHKWQVTGDKNIKCYGHTLDMFQKFSASNGGDHLNKKMFIELRRNVYPCHQ